MSSWCSSIEQKTVIYDSLDIISIAIVFMYFIHGKRAFYHKRERLIKKHWYIRHLIFIHIYYGINNCLGIVLWNYLYFGKLAHSIDYRNMIILADNRTIQAKSSIIFHIYE